MIVTISDAVLQPLMRIPADVSSVGGRYPILEGIRRMQQPFCGLTALDTVALLVANAKQIANNHLTVTILYMQIRAWRQDFAALL